MKPKKGDLLQGRDLFKYMNQVYYLENIGINIYFKVINPNILVKASDCEICLKLLKE